MRSKFDIYVFNVYLVYPTKSGIYVIYGSMEGTCGNFHLPRGHEILTRGHDILSLEHEILTHDLEIADSCSRDS